MNLTHRFIASAVAGVILISGAACSADRSSAVPDDAPAEEPAPLGRPPVTSTDDGGDGETDEAVPAQVTSAAAAWAESTCALLAGVDARSRVSERLLTLDPATLDETGLRALVDSAESVRLVAAEIDEIADAIASRPGPGLPNGAEIASGYADLVRVDAAVVRAVGDALAGIDPTLPVQIALTRLNQSMFSAVATGDQAVAAAQRVNAADSDLAIYRALVGSEACQRLSLVRGHVQNLDAVR